MTLTRKQALRAICGSIGGLFIAGYAKATGFTMPGVKMDWDVSKIDPALCDGSRGSVCVAGLSGEPVNGTETFEIDFGNFRSITFRKGTESIVLTGQEIWESLKPEPKPSNLL